MAQGLRIILFSAQDQDGPVLREALHKFEGVKVVSEVSEPALLPQVVAQLPADVLVVQLDPAPETILPIAGQIASSHPELAVFAVSESTDGQLILSAMRQGLKEFLTKPIDHQMLGEALRRVAETVTDRAKQGRLISVLGGSGGVGTTTVATNLAVELASLNGGSVCVVDLDLRFGQVATLLDVEPKYSVADLCETHERLEQQVIEKALVTHSSGVRILCSPPNIAQAEHITAAHCVGVLSGLVSFHDFVVLDGPLRYDPGIKAVLDIADNVLLVTELLVPSVRNVQRILQGMRHVGFDLDRINLVCNRFGRDASSLGVHDVESTLNLTTFATIPDDWPAVSGAVNLGEPLAKSHPRSKARQAICEIAERLHGPSDGADDNDNGRKGGLLSKIFSDA